MFKIPILNEDCSMYWLTVWILLEVTIRVWVYVIITVVILIRNEDWTCTKLYSISYFVKKIFVCLTRFWLWRSFGRIALLFDAVDHWYSTPVSSGQARICFIFFVYWRWWLIMLKSLWTQFLYAVKCSF